MWILQLCVLLFKDCASYLVFILSIAKRKLGFAFQFLTRRQCQRKKRNQQHLLNHGKVDFIQYHPWVTLASFYLEYLHTNKFPLNYHRLGLIY